MCPDGDDCVAVREILNRVGDKWSLCAITRLRDGPVRFMALKRDSERISQRMLTLTLKGLEKDGIVTRTMFPTIPPRVDYALTPLGETFLEPVPSLISWAGTHQSEIHAAREHFIRA